MKWISDRNPSSPGMYAVRRVNYSIDSKDLNFYYFDGEKWLNASYPYDVMSPCECRSQWSVIDWGRDDKPKSEGHVLTGNPDVKLSFIQHGVWYKVSETPIPDDIDKVLFYFTDCDEIEIYERGSLPNLWFFYNTDDTCNLLRVTHWMPFPEPPKC
jgi:hypothetical protein